MLLRRFAAALGSACIVAVVPACIDLREDSSDGGKGRSGGGGTSGNAGAGVSGSGGTAAGGNGVGGNGAGGTPSGGTGAGGAATGGTGAGGSGGTGIGGGIPVPDEPLSRHIVVDDFGYRPGAAK